MTISAKAKVEFGLDAIHILLFIVWFADSYTSKSQKFGNTLAKYFHRTLSGFFSKKDLTQLFSTHFWKIVWQLQSYLVRSLCFARIRSERRVLNEQLWSNHFNERSMIDFCFFSSNLRLSTLIHDTARAQSFENGTTTDQVQFRASVRSWYFR
jgi:hypothetical protein